MAWKPNKWLAVILSFFVWPLGMLYVASARWTLVYFSIVILTFSNDIFHLTNTSLSWLGGILALASILHAFVIALRAEPSTKRPWYSRWYGLISVYISFFLIVFITRAFSYDIFTMPAASMWPSIQAGSTIAVTKWGYGNYGVFGVSLLKTKRTKPIKRGDVMVFSYPRDPSINYVKRVVGLPGDHIAYYSKSLYVNNVIINTEHIEDIEEYSVYLEDNTETEYYISLIRGSKSILEGEVLVPDNQYYVLGDNRDNSNDSRVWGFLPEQNLIGKVVKVFE